MEPIYFLGIGLALLANAVNALGMNLQRYSHTNQSDRPLFKRPAYLIGLLCLGLTEVFNFLALSFTPASVTAPLNAFGIICSTLFGKFFFKENVSSNSIGGIMFIVIGTVFTVIFGPNTSKDLDVQDFMTQIKKPGSIAYISVCVGLMVFVGIVFRKNLYGLIFVAAISAGNTITLTKVLAVFVKLSITTANQMAQALPYIIVVLIGLMVGLQLYFINKAMERAPSHIVTAIYTVVLTIGVMVAATFLFNEATSLTKGHLSLFILGIILIAGGVLTIAYGTDKEEEEGDIPDQEPLLPDRETDLATDQEPSQP